MAQNYKNTLYNLQLGKNRYIYKKPYFPITYQILNHLKKDASWASACTYLQKVMKENKNHKKVIQNIFNQPEFRQIISYQTLYRLEICTWYRSIKTILKLNRKNEPQLKIIQDALLGILKKLSINTEISVEYCNELQKLILPKEKCSLIPELQQLRLLITKLIKEDDEGKLKSIENVVSEWIHRKQFRLRYLKKCSQSELQNKQIKEEQKQEIQPQQHFIKQEEQCQRQIYPSNSVEKSSFDNLLHIYKYVEHSLEEIKLMVFDEESHTNNNYRDPFLEQNGDQIIFGKNEGQSEIEHSKEKELNKESIRKGEGQDSCDKMVSSKKEDIISQENLQSLLKSYNSKTDRSNSEQKKSKIFRNRLFTEESQKTGKSPKKLPPFLIQLSRKQQENLLTETLL